MHRMGQVLMLRPDAVTRYKELHAAVWDDVLATISAANITNYSIFLREPENLLFAYWEYLGDDFERDMETLSRVPAMKEWWALCEPLQQPLESRAEGEWWARMEPVFYHP